MLHLSARDPEFWRELAPALHIDDASYLGAARCFAYPDDALAEIRNQLRHEGYFQLPPATWHADVDRTARAVEAISRAGWMPPFVFVYDEMWLLFMQLNRLLGAILGRGFLRLPEFWAWFVDPQKAESGWTPHRDKGRRALLPDGMPMTLTIWLPLTDATPSNGCIYLVPADRDPTYGTPQENQHSFPLQAIRALPAAAGSVLGWNAAVLHWGGESSARAATPRISAAFEFQRGDIPPFNRPAMRPDEVPSFAARLQLIAKQVLQYRHMAPLDAETSALMESLLSR